MDPITASIVIVLGKYALDQGAELLRDVGPTALETAKEMFNVALGRLRQKPTGQVVADEFEKDPKTYEKPVEKALGEEAKADPDFAKQLEELWKKYEEAAREHAAVSGKTYRAVVTGSGAAAQDHSVAAGEGGIAVGGDVEGGITLGSKKKK